MRWISLTVCALCLFVPSAFGWQVGEKPVTAAKETEKAEVSVTHHTVTIGGETVAYTATVGYMKLPDYEGEPRADVFFYCVYPGW